MLRIKAFYQQTQPQILLEEILNYYMQGQQYYDPDKLCQRFAIIPHGNRLYTGMIQALCYDYLSHTDTKTLILLIEDENITQPTITTEQNSELILGQNINIDQNLTPHFTPFCISHTQAIQNNQAFLSQLPFIRTLTNHSIFPILIPRQASPHSQKLLTGLKKIMKNNADIACACITQSTYQTPLANSMNQDRKLILKLQNQNKSKRLPDTHHLQIFSKLINALNHQLQLVIYANSGETNGDQKNNRGFCCMVG